MSEATQGAPAESAEGGESSEISEAHEGEGLKLDGDLGDVSEAEGERFTLKVNGEDVELTRAEVLARAQKAEGVERKFEEVAKQRKQLEQIAEALQSDPLSALERMMGKEQAQAQLMERLFSDEAMVDRMAQRMLEVFEYSEKSPEERAKVDEEKELRRKAKKAEEYEAKQAEARMAQQVERTQAQLKDQFTRALDAHGLGGNALAMRRMSALVEAAIESGDRTLTFERVAQSVAEDILGNRNTYLEELAGVDDDEKLYGSLPEGLLKRLRAAEARRLKGSVASKVEVAKPNGAAPKRDREPRYSEDFFARLNGD